VSATPATQGEKPRTLGQRFYNAVTMGVAQIVGISNPGRAMAYIQQRQALLSYAAASRRGPNGAWRPKNKTEDDVLRQDWPLITARARDLARNSGHVSGALEKIAANVVFSGIKPQCQLRTGDRKLDSTRNRAVEAVWKRWAEHPRVNFYDLQELAIRHSWVDGECLLHLYSSPTLMREGVVPLGVEMLEADHLDSSVNGEQPNGNRAVRGVEFDAEGYPLAYHLYTEHPGATLTSVRSISLYKSVRVPAEQIIHPYARRRASQSRGVSWLASVIMEMRDLDEYQDSERIAARLTSAFGFFVESAYPEMTAAMLGGQGLPGHGLPGGAPGGAEVKLPDFIEKGRIQQLPPGTKINAAGYSRPGNTYDPFVKTQLKGASAGLGMSYTAFANDPGETNYSGGRTATLEERRSYQRQQMYLVRKLCSPLWRVWCQYLTLSGLASGLALPVGDIPVTWQTPGWDWVDPQKDAGAQEKLLGLKVTSRRRIAASRGDDLDEIIEELREEDDAYGEMLNPAPAPTDGQSANQEGDNAA